MMMMMCMCVCVCVCVCAGPALVIVGMVMSVESRGEEGEGGRELERQLVAWLEGNGMDDPHGYFTRQLATMAEVHVQYIYSICVMM